MGLPIYCPIIKEMCVAPEKPCSHFYKAQKEDAWGKPIGQPYDACLEVEYKHALLKNIHLEREGSIPLPQDF